MNKPTQFRAKPIHVQNQAGEKYSGFLLFQDDALIAVLTFISAEESDGPRNLFVEAAFGRYDALEYQQFGSLEEAELAAEASMLEERPLSS